MVAYAPLNGVFELARFNLNGSLHFGAVQDGSLVSAPMAEDFAGCFLYAEQLQAQALDIYGDDRSAPPKPVGPAFDPYDLQPHLYIDDIPTMNRAGVRGQWLGLGYYRMCSPHNYEVQHGPRVHIRTESRSDKSDQPFAPHKLAIESIRSGYNLRVVQEEGITIGPEAPAPWAKLGIEISSRTFIQRLFGPKHIGPQLQSDPQVRAFYPEDVGVLFQLAQQIYLSNPGRWWQGFTFNVGSSGKGKRYVLSMSEEQRPFLIDEAGMIIDAADYKPDAKMKRTWFQIESIASDHINGPKTPLLSIAMDKHTIDISEHILFPLGAMFSPRISHLFLRTNREITVQLARLNALSHEDLLACLARNFGLHESDPRRNGPGH